MNSKVIPKLEELHDPVHPIKSMLLESVVESVVGTLSMIPSYPLIMAKTQVAHSQKTAEEWQGEVTEMSNAVSNLTWSSAWKCFGLSCLGMYNYLFFNSFVAKYLEYKIRGTTKKSKPISKVQRYGITFASSAISGVICYPM